MTKANAVASSEKLAETIIEGAIEKKGQELTLLDLRQLDNAISDFFVICHGSSNRQVDAIADSVIEQVQQQLGEKPINIEGKSQAEWILIDYVNVVVHIFQPEQRAHYAIEELWADAQIQHVTEK